TVSYAVQSIRACLSWALAERRIPALPFGRLPRPSTTSRGIEYVLRPEQESEVFGRVRGGFRELLVVLRETGCRPSEAFRAAARPFTPSMNALVFPANDRGKPGHKTARKTRRARVIFLGRESGEIVARLAAERPTGWLFTTAGYHTRG